MFIHGRFGRRNHDGITPWGPRTIASALLYFLWAAPAFPFVGDLDTSFNGTGVASAHFRTDASWDVAHAAALQPDGKVVVGGRAPVGRVAGREIDRTSAAEAAYRTSTRDRCGSTSTASQRGEQ